MTTVRAGMSRRVSYAKSFASQPILDHENLLDNRMRVRKSTKKAVTLRDHQRASTVAMSLVLAISLIAAIFIGFSLRAPRVAAYTSHAVIVIGQDTDFTDLNGVTGGTGTTSDPYIISGWEILSNSNEAIYIHDTTAYFVVRDVYVHGTGFWNGIHFANMMHGSIVNSTVTMNQVGIRLEGASYVTVADNTLDDQSESGVTLSYASFVRIENNSIDHDAYAVYSGSNVHDVLIANNSMDDSNYGGLVASGSAAQFSIMDNTIRSSLHGYGIAFYGPADTTYIADNNLSENILGGVMFGDVTTSNVIMNNTILDCTGGYGIRIATGNLNIIEGNRIGSNGYGVYISSESDGNLVRNNNIFQNDEGIYVTSYDPAYTCDWNNITGNTISASTTDGIWLSYGHHNIVSWNNVTGSGYGIFVDSNSASSNWIFLNNFTGDSVNAYSTNPTGTNWWNTSVQVSYKYGGQDWVGFLGNRYGDYSGADANNNGVGESPYAVGTEQDLYPLTVTPSVLVPEFPGVLLPVIVLTILFGILSSAYARRQKQ
jgi:parallel beta-helix repeat protein